MDIMIVQTIYGVVCILGLELYTYIGWKSKKVPFDLSIALSTLMHSGTISMIGSMVGLAESGLTLGGLLAAFTMGAGIEL